MILLPSFLQPPAPWRDPTDEERAAASRIQAADVVATVVRLFKVLRAERWCLTYHLSPWVEHALHEQATTFVAASEWELLRIGLAAPLRGLPPGEGLHPLHVVLMDGAEVLATVPLRRAGEGS